MSKTTPYPLFALVVLFLASMACTETEPNKEAFIRLVSQTPSSTPTATPTPTPTATSTPKGGGRCVITASTLNVRACPGIDCAAIDVLENGQTVEAFPVADGWLVLTLADDRTGYIAARYCVLLGE